MITDAQQYRIHNGDTEAFAALCRDVAMPVYRDAVSALGDGEAAKRAVKRILLALRAEICAADGPLDVAARLTALKRDVLSPTAADAPEPAEAAARTAEDAWTSAGLPEPAVEAAHDEVRYDGRAYRKPGPGRVGLLALTIALALLFVWLALYALMRMGVLPTRDLGYGWFFERVWGRMPNIA